MNKFSRGFTHLIIILLVTFVGVITVVCFMFSSNLKDNPQENIVLQPQIDTNEPGTNLSDWKSYTNTKNGYSLRFPTKDDNYEIVESTNKNFVKIFGEEYSEPPFKGKQRKSVCYLFRYQPLVA